MKLIDALSRKDCMTLEYGNDDDFCAYREEVRFWKFGEYDFFVPKHNGACVYECYAEATGLTWSAVCDCLLDCTYDEVVESKYQTLCKVLADLTLSAEMGYTPSPDLKKRIDSLRKDKEDGMFASSTATLSYASFGSSDIDVILSARLKVAVLLFKLCDNGGGLTLPFHCGLEYYRTSK
jgi:hypothetical protein